MFVKKKDFEMLENKVELLENKVEVLEFQRDNPNGLKVINNILFGDRLQYIKNGNIKSFKLPKINSFAWDLEENNLLIKSEQYKFDIENEMLIKIEKQTDTSSKSEEKDIKKTRSKKK